MSLGGSVIFPNKIDMKFLREFKKIIKKFVKKNYRFAIYCGGGKLARNFQKAAVKFKFNNEALDWLGIYATRINANSIKKLFGPKANTVSIEHDGDHTETLYDYTFVIGEDQSEISLPKVGT